ncbi:hypothetical protein GGF32_007749, partial [Allomyces javanicus]
MAVVRESAGLGLTKEYDPPLNKRQSAAEFNDLDLILATDTLKGLQVLADHFGFKVGKSGRQPTQQWARSLFASQKARLQAARKEQ